MLKKSKITYFGSFQSIDILSLRYSYMMLWLTRNISIVYAQVCMYVCIRMVQYFIHTCVFNYKVFVDKCFFFHIPPFLVQTHTDRPFFFVLCLPIPIKMKICTYVYIYEINSIIIYYKKKNFKKKYLRLYLE